MKRLVDTFNNKFRTRFKADEVRIGAGVNANNFNGRRSGKAMLRWMCTNKKCAGNECELARAPGMPLLRLFLYFYYFYHAQK